MVVTAVERPALRLVAVAVSVVVAVGEGVDVVDEHATDACTADCWVPWPLPRR